MTKLPYLERRSDTTKDFPSVCARGKQTGCVATFDGRRPWLSTAGVSDLRTSISGLNATIGSPSAAT